MKRTITLIAAFLFSVGVYAQSYLVQHDTVTSTPTGSVTIVDGITATSASVTLKWKIIESNFPADWLMYGTSAVMSMCDNNQCYPGNGLWLYGSGTVATKTSYPYTTTMGDFHMVIDLTTATTLGCYYVKVRLENSTVSTDTAIETYIVCKPTPTSAPYIVKSADEIILYPNPAHDEVNLVYDAGSDIKMIAVYNIIGKVMAMYKATDSNSANLNLENIPSGIYFARLINSQGNVVCTRKFTKQ